MYVGHLRGPQRLHLTLPNSKACSALVAVGSTSVVPLGAQSIEEVRALETLNVPLSCLEIEKAET